MKNIFKTLIMAVAAVLAVSCNVENIGTKYTDASKCVSFLTTIATDTEIDAAASTYSILLSRGDSKGELVVKLEDTFEEGVVCPASVTFKDGNSTATIDLDVTDLVVGTKYVGEITILDIDPKINNNTIKVTLQKAYSWEKFGEGQYFDSFLLQIEYETEEEFNIQKVEVQKAQGFNIYRVMNPLPKEAVELAWGSSMVMDKGCSYIEFSVDNDGQVRYGDGVSTGYKYKDALLTYYFPSAVEELGDEYNRLRENGTIVEFYWCQVTASGTWWGGCYPAYLALPSFKGNFFEWLVEETSE